MHPTFRHTPPMYSRSITQVLTLSWPSRIAAGYPPGPAPITTASKRCSAMAALYHAQNFKEGDGLDLDVVEARDAVDDVLSRPIHRCRCFPRVSSAAVVNRTAVTRSSRADKETTM